MEAWKLDQTVSMGLSRIQLFHVEATNRLKILLNNIKNTLSSVLLDSLVPLTWDYQEKLIILYHLSSVTINIQKILLNDDSDFAALFWLSNQLCYANVFLKLNNESQKMWPNYDSTCYIWMSIVSDMKAKYLDQRVSIGSSRLPTG